MARGPNGGGPGTYTFDGRGSSDAEGDVLTYLWEDTEGHTSTAATVDFDVADPETYAVTLSVTDQLGETGTAAIELKRALPTVSVTAPVGGDVVSGPVRLAADAADADGIAEVRFRVTNTRTDPLPEGLVLALGYDDGAGNNGTVSGARWVAGKYGKALNFDGVDDWVTVPDADSLDLTDEFTLSTWVRPDAVVSEWQQVILKESAGNLTYCLYASDTSTDARPFGMVNFGGNDYPTAAAGPALPAGLWSHLAATWDGSSLRLYVDCQLRTTEPIGGTLPVSDGPLRIGGNSIWNYEFFDGALDEIRFYNRALTTTDITTDRDTPTP